MLRYEPPESEDGLTCFMMASRPGPPVPDKTPCNPPAPESIPCRLGPSPLIPAPADVALPAGEPAPPPRVLLITVRGDPTPTPGPRLAKGELALPTPIPPRVMLCGTRGERDGPASGCGRADMGRLAVELAGEPEGREGSEMEVAIPGEEWEAG